MIIRQVIICLIIMTISLNAIEQQNGILILEDSDFPQVLKDYPFIMIQFYAPWCGHCKQLAPVYEQLALSLIKSDIPVRLAKVDATEEQKISRKYSIQGYPTLIFFDHEQINNYKGALKKEVLYNWLLKRTNDPITKIDAQAYKKLIEEKKETVSIIIHGYETDIQYVIYQGLSKNDEYNNYYYIQGIKEKGTIEMIRPFGETITFKKFEKKFQEWLKFYQRPPVLPIDDRTLESLFSRNLNSICFFNDGSSKEIIPILQAISYKFYEENKNLLFIQIKKQSQHFIDFAEFLHLNIQKSPLVILNPKKQLKYLINSSVSQITAEIIENNLQKWEKNELQGVQMVGQIEQMESQNQNQQQL